MDTGKGDNYEYYNGFEDEPELTIYIPNADYPALHVWMGYIEDIFDNAIVSDNGWKGLTRDYQEDKGVFSSENGCYTIANATDTEEYLNDLLQYQGTSFQYSETQKILEILIDLFRDATQNKSTVVIKYF